MKKLLAVLLAFAMLFAFAACGGNTDDSTTTTTDLFAGMEEDTTVAPEAEDDTTAESVPADATTAADETTAAEDTTAADATTVAGETTVATTAATTAASKGLTSSDIAAVVDYYNKAVVKTDEAGETAGQSTMTLASDITGDGGVGMIAKVLTPIAKTVLANNSSSTNDIPGRGTLKASDVSKAQASSKNGVTTIVIQVKDQTDGPSADGKDGGPVARAIGTLGSIDGALEQLGVSFSRGKETVTLTYTNAYIKCTINENTGKITGGEWHYLVKINVGDATASLKGIEADVRNLKADVEYKVAI